MFGCCFFPEVFVPGVVACGGGLVMLQGARLRPGWAVGAAVALGINFGAAAMLLSEGSRGVPVGEVVASGVPCGVFSAVSEWVALQQWGSTVGDPVGWDRDSSVDYIGAAELLSQVDVGAVSAQLRSGLRSYVVSLAALGAAIDHGESDDSIADLHLVAGAAGEVVEQLCGVQ